MAEFDGLSDGQAWAARTGRASALAGVLCQAQADLVAFTVELLASSGWAGDGVRSPEHWLQVYTGLGVGQCRDLVRVAERAPDLGAVVARMETGAVTLDQAAVIARHLPAETPEEVVDQVAHLAEATTTTQLARVVAHYHFDREQPPHEEPRDKPEHRPATLSLHQRDGRFVLRYECTPTDGVLVEQAVREAKDALFTSGQTGATLADGLREVCTRSLSAVSGVERRETYRVLIHLDVDDHAWVNRRGALPANLARHVTCDGTITPVWERDGVPVAVGRGQRIVPRRTRRLIEDRDRGCRFPGCPVTGFLENHHIVHWRDGGPTDPQNLVSLCPHHHRAHHQGEFTIAGSPTTADGLTFTTPGGHTIGRPAPPSPAADGGVAPTVAAHLRAHWPDRPQVARSPFRGERLSWGSINFDGSNHDPRIHRVRRPRRTRVPEPHRRE
ncbi:HNH endonuclease signature motif containing protein [Aestuariimicrobium kwangyangense]|uniref:HNH endonuclease signature motif containing protein n=1 Tax=Aestuariimicrobium kwangyangense TaxID=396389 RepID=UPI0003B3FE4D|nr:HNH endonuclease signature motif containing protein [Aestuariimicrobium kwangyangense]